MSKKRLVLRSLVVLAAVVVAAGCFALWVVGTAPGTRFAWRIASPMLPEGVTVASVDGRLAGALELSGIAVRMPTLEIEIERLSAQWRPAALLGSQVEIERVELSGIAVTTVPGEAPASDEEPTSFALPERLELPLDVSLGELWVDDLSYRSAPDAEPIIVETVRLGGQWTSESLALEIREARGPLFTVEGRMDAAPASPFDLDARLDWTFEPAGYAPVAGRTTLTGSLRSLLVEQRLEAPYRIDLTLRVDEPLGEPGLDGSAGFELATADIGSDLAPLTLAGELTVAGTIDDLAVGLDAALATPDVGSVEVLTSVRYEGDVITIESLELGHVDSGASLSGRGRAMLGDPLELDVTARWADLRWPLTGMATVVSDAGEIDLDGSLDAFAFTVAGDLVASDLPGRFRLAGSGSTEAIELESLELDGLGGSASGRANVRFSPALEADVALTLDGIDPGAVLAGWSGELDGELSAAARTEGDSIAAEIETLELSGRLRDRELALDARGRYAGETITIDRLALRTGSSELEAQASISDAIDVDLAIESPDLADFWPGFSGTLSVDATAIGPLWRPRITLDASGSNISGLDLRVERLAATADIDLEGDAASRLDIMLANGIVAGTQIESLTLTGQGNAAGHEIVLAAAAAPGSVDLALGGRIESLWQSDVSWHFDLETASLDPADVGAWRLARASSGTVAGDAVTLERTCWRPGPELAAGAELCVEATQTAGRSEATFALDELPFAYFAGFIGDAVTIDGALSAAGRVSLAAGMAPDLDLEVTSTSGSVRPRAAAETAIEFGELDATIAGRDDTFEGELVWPLTADGRIELGGRLGAASDGEGDRPIEARINADIESLAFLSELSDAIDGLRGALRGELAISGSLETPRMAGSLALVDGAVTVTDLGARFENVMLELRADQAGAVDVEASLESGGGSLRADGQLATTGGGTGRLTILGDRFEIVNTADARIAASPELELVVAAERIDLTGVVRVPDARITPAGSEPGAVGVSGDEVIVDPGAEGAAEESMLRPLYATVVLELGDDVEIEGFGLMGNLAGSLEITETPGEPTTGSGELRVEDGTYEAYGQELEVRTGRLLFAGGVLTRPGLDIEAVRRPTEDILVGARVRGTLEQPELSLFSEPAMQQQEQLSYLVLGRSLQGASQSEESALSRAALALGLRGGNFVSERINESLGLDEFGIQTAPGESASTASFVVGKYLSPSLYVSYGIGLFESVSTLNLRYKISDRWQVLTESSTEGSGGDIIYSIERSGGSRD